MEQACLLYQQVLQSDPGNVEIWMAVGNLRAKAGAFEAAAEAFAHVVALRPDQAAGWINHGNALRRIGQRDEAVSALRRGIALERDPQHLEARNNLVVALIRAGQSGEALAECDRYLSQSPANPKAMAYKAAALIELERRQEAAFLLDFDRLLFKHRIDVPVGYASIEALNGALALQIEAHPSLRFEPDEKSTRGGSQTGEFAHAATGAAAALRGAIVAAVRGYIDRMRAARGDQGAIEFGRTSAAIGGTQEPLIATVAPREGTLLLFPSYFYHRTIPFEAEGNRVSVAFDVLPD